MSNQSWISQYNYYGYSPKSWTDWGRIGWKSVPASQGIWNYLDGGNF